MICLTERRESQSPPAWIAPWRKLDPLETTDSAEAFLSWVLTRNPPEPDPDVLKPRCLKHALTVMLHDLGLASSIFFNGSDAVGRFCGSDL